MNTFKTLQDLQIPPEPFSDYTRLKLWNDPHLSVSLLEAHLDPESDAASRNAIFMQQSFKWILEKFQIGPGSQVIDYGCGPGHYTTAYAKAGAKVSGIDFSERSILWAREQAHKNALNINYVLGNYLDFKTDEKFDLITMIWCDFSCLSPSQRQTLLAKFASQLKPGGKVLLDADSLVRFEKEPELPVSYTYEPNGGFFAPEAYHMFMSQHRYEDCNVILRRESVFSDQENYELLHWSQCYSKESLQSEFNKAGLTITEFYSDVTGQPWDDESWVISAVAEKIR